MALCTMGMALMGLGSTMVDPIPMVDPNPMSAIPIVHRAIAFDAGP